MAHFLGQHFLFSSFGRRTSLGATSPTQPHSRWSLNFEPGPVPEMLDPGRAVALDHLGSRAPAFSPQSKVVKSRTASLAVVRLGHTQQHGGGGIPYPFCHHTWRKVEPPTLKRGVVWAGGMSVGLC